MDCANFENSIICGYLRVETSSVNGIKYKRSYQYIGTEKIDYILKAAYSLAFAWQKMISIRSPIILIE